MHAHAECYLALEKNRASKIARQNGLLEKRYAKLKAHAKKTQVEHNHATARKAALAQALHEFTLANPSAAEHNEVIRVFLDGSVFLLGQGIPHLQIRFHR